MCMYARIKFLRRAVIHASAVWAGQGRAVWVSHPGQVGDRAGQGRAVVRQYAAGQDHKQSGQVGCQEAGPNCRLRFKNSRREKKARIIAVDLRFTPHSH